MLIIHFFWYLSDYGYNTIRVISWFFLFILFFSLVYTVFPQILALDGTAFSPQGMGGYVEHFFRMVMFATSTMVTLGFSNINVSTQGGPNWAGMFVVTTNLMAGYFMLAVLVTRLAILFQTMGPGMVLLKKREQKKAGTL